MYELLTLSLANTTGSTQFENFERAMPESKACLEHYQTSVMELLYENISCYKLFTIFVKKLHHRYLIGSLTSLRLYFHSLLILRIVFDLESQTLAKTMFT